MDAVKAQLRTLPEEVTRLPADPAVRCASRATHRGARPVRPEPPAREWAGLPTLESMPAEPTTFPALLERLLATDGARPLLTFYDGATGERTELSVTTYANWVAKTASLLAEECDLERGGTLRLDLPTHWLGPVLLGAAWSIGATADLDGAGPAPDVVACGPDGLATWGPRAGRVTVLASALLPMAVRFPEPPGPGVLDLGVEIWSQPDAFVPLEPPRPGDDAVPGTGQAALWESAASDAVVADGGRLLSEANPASPAGLSSFTAPLCRHGSLVLVARCGEDRVEELVAQERATARS